VLAEERDYPRHSSLDSLTHDLVQFPALGNALEKGNLDRRGTDGMAYGCLGREGYGGGPDAGHNEPEHPPIGRSGGHLIARTDPSHTAQVVKLWSFEDDRLFPIVVVRQDELFHRDCR
jgi:hypothetical protein